MSFTCLRAFAGITLAAALLLPPAFAQQNNTTTSDSQSQPQPDKPWLVQCRSKARDAPLSCSMEQRLLLRKTGQQVARLSIRVDGTEPRAPAVLIQLPHGLSIPEGVAIQVDDQKAVRFAIRTCDSAGCYASGALGQDLLTSFKKGNQARISFANLQKKVIRVSFSLADFTASYFRIQ